MSMAVLPLPLQVSSSVPPFTVRSPLESMQSPSETMVNVPPLMTIQQLSSAANGSFDAAPEPFAAFRPSSEETMSYSPPLIVSVRPSMPS